MDLMPIRGSTFAESVDTLFTFLVSISGFMSFVIAATLAYFAIRYRRRAKVDRSNPPTTAHRMEFIWSAIPLAVFLFIFFWSAQQYMVWAVPPPNALEVY